MIAGDPSAWLSKFRTAERRIVAALPDVWPRCGDGLGPRPLEDAITRNLAHHLKQHPKARRVGIIEYHKTLLEQQRRGDVTTKGVIDIAVLLGRLQDCYVAFECKRLNVQFDSGFDSLAGPYVEEGVMRYVSAQYAEGLPLGAMVGYVFDGDTGAAQGHVQAAIAGRSAVLRCSKPPEHLAGPRGFRRFVTRHARTGSPAFEVCHTLLPFPAPTSGGAAPRPRGRRRDA